MKKGSDTRVVRVRNGTTFSTSTPREMQITLPRMPWEPKEEIKEEA
ncbi:MAG: hypothetical protein RLZ51_1886 [Pseudomonadota bacterium]|jgi:hypothetical protein